MGYYEGEIGSLCGNNNNNGWNDWSWIIGLALVGGLFGNGGFGFGGGFGNGAWGGFYPYAYPYGFGFGGCGCNNDCATQADVRAAVDQQTLISKIDQQTYGLADTFNSLNNTLNNNFRGVDNAICNLGYNIATQFAGVDKAFCTQGYQTQAGFNSLSRELADCCCSTKQLISEVRYDNAKNTCDIIRAGQDNTRAILDYLTGEKISSLQAENAGLKAQISNDRQSAYIIDALAPKCPQASYLVQAPTKINFPVDCCGNFTGFNNGCGCN